jgi:hypothetical protein
MYVLRLLSPSVSWLRLSHRIRLFSRALSLSSSLSKVNVFSLPNSLCLFVCLSVCLSVSVCVSESPCPFTLSLSKRLFTLSLTCVSFLSHSHSRSPLSKLTPSPRLHSYHPTAHTGVLFDILEDHTSSTTAAIHSDHVALVSLTDRDGEYHNIDMYTHTSKLRLCNPEDMVDGNTLSPSLSGDLSSPTAGGVGMQPSVSATLDADEAEAANLLQKRSFREELRKLVSDVGAVEAQCRQAAE